MESYRQNNNAHNAVSRDFTKRDGSRDWGNERERATDRYSASDSYSGRDNRVGRDRNGYQRDRDVNPSFRRDERREDYQRNDRRDDRRDEYRDNRDSRRDDFRDNRRDERRGYGDDKRREHDFDRAVDARDKASHYNTGDESLRKKHHDTLLKDPVTSSDPDKSPDTIYISNLPQSVTESSLARFFGTVGIIKNDKKTGNPKVWIYKDKSTGLPKGDATVTFEDPSASDGAISWFDGKMFEGKTIKVEKAQAIKPPPGGWNARRGGRGRW